MLASLSFASATGLLYLSRTLHFLAPVLRFAFQVLQFVEVQVFNFLLRQAVLPSADYPQVKASSDLTTLSYLRKSDRAFPATPYSGFPNRECEPYIPRYCCPSFTSFDSVLTFPPQAKTIWYSIIFGKPKQLLGLKKCQYFTSRGPSTYQFQFQVALL